MKLIILTSLLLAMTFSVNAAAVKKARGVASSFEDKMQSEVSDDSVGVCHMRFVRRNLSLEPVTGPKMVKEACYMMAQSYLMEKGEAFTMVIVKHNGEFKSFENK